MKGIPQRTTLCKCSFCSQEEDCVMSSWQYPQCLIKRKNFDSKSDNEGTQNSRKIDPIDCLSDINSNSKESYHQCDRNVKSTISEITLQGLFQLPVESVHQLCQKSPGLKKEHSFTGRSFKPFQCPDFSCRKIVTCSTFANHFNREHKDIPIIPLKLSSANDLLLYFNPSDIRPKSTRCLVGINLYVLDQVDVSNSKSSLSVIKTCNKFQRKVVIDTFWLMVTGLADINCVFWVMSISNHPRKTTIELSSKNETFSLSAYCPVVVQKHNNEFHVKDIMANLQGLMVTEEHFTGFLQEGPQLNLRISLH